ncbi:MAG TPA: hypothetical protein DEV81_06705, partial [Cyanobacteria bacterium UBA11049]|nr:hypothetical protein [Cyanobacteria bacterium UBA11049]
QELIAAIADIARQVYVEPHHRTKFATMMQQHDAVSKFEARAYRKDGSIIWISEHARTVRNSNGEILYYQGFVQDITERKQTEQLLAEYNQALEQKVEERTQELSQALSELRATQEELIQSEKMAALGQLVAGIAHEINTPLGAIRSSVSNITKFLNQTLQELPALLQSLPPEVTQDFLALVQRSLQQKSTFSAKERRQLKRALIRQLEAFEVEKAQILADILGDMGIYQDVEAFLPLLTRPDSEHLLEIAYKLSGIQRGTQTIETATERAAKVVFALKTYARYDFSGEMRPANPIEGIETVLTLYHNQLKHGVEIIRHYDEFPPVLCYPDELNQVWTNLIHNALQAMENKGTLTIDVTRQSQLLKVSITDSGKGIPPEIMPKIFDPFFTTKPVGVGTGLGLSISYQIVVEKHGGQLDCHSQLGQGTEFVIQIPLCQQDQEPQIFLAQS